MRHNKKNNHLGRKAAHRDAMLSNMATSLIMHKRIFTTVPKAKELRKFVEPIITKSKEDTTSSRRVVFSILQNKFAVTELFQYISQKVADRPGGYTRIIKTGYRLGDNAAMCFIELVDYNENMLGDGGAKKAKTRRSRRKATTAAAPATATDSKAKEPKVKKEEAKAEEVKAEETVELKDTKEVNASEVPVTEKVDTQDKTQIAEGASAEGEGLKD
ncbi:MAG TPA: 50S ribosomal protein L17 [Porphyromonadaceae bacterium]|jgi:large subunit ribosomal protein L17|uniref:50S ribosomal protein L17 n=1 Tax=bioreactor metagenome TaxID=1076179 RepID=A0A645DCZ7_9ZZZZ|nr:50S ribosomal protein L17 [Bacteroidales bacterium]BBD46224.1 50S ribosomal protein L17 [Petrimonas sp. IBARAKI]HBC37468.1 50S ribosomal protein L17 [Porphyromonadaceae bacterium]HBK42536.1 50S ribosomal protein L17 [Porphyromonadaceae bacterium]HCB88103.1 50S ribosomal protein L17 [Porphyromonadaceae bacterium]